jgi:hypothetical protein
MIGKSHGPLFMRSCEIGFDEEDIHRGIYKKIEWIEWDDKNLKYNYQICTILLNI